MTREFGLFNDEGCVERQFYSRAEVRQAFSERYTEDDELEIFECCPDHPDYPRSCCEECDTEEEEDARMAEEDDDAHYVSDDE